MAIAILSIVYLALTYLIFKQISFIKIFRKQRITNPGASRALSSLGIKNNFLFKQLVSKNVIQHVKGEKYFLDLENGLSFAKKRRGQFYTWTVLCLIIFFFIWNNFY